MFLLCPFCYEIGVSFLYALVVTSTTFGLVSMYLAVEGLLFLVLLPS